MSDYIDRAKAIEEINKYHMTSGVSNQGTWNECVDVIAHTVAELPSADVISIDQANAMIKSYVSHYEENKCFDGMTNGEVIQALFPDGQMISADSGVIEYATAHANIMVSLDFWNSHYQKGGE